MFKLFINVVNNISTIKCHEEKLSILCCIANIPTFQNSSSKYEVHE